MLITSHRKPATPILCCPLSINRIYVSPAFLSNNINRHHLAAIYLEAVYCLWKVNFYSQNLRLKESSVFWVANYIHVVATSLSFQFTYTLHIPLSSSTVQLIVQNLPEVYLEKLLTFLADCLDNSPHLQFYLHWCTQLLTIHGDNLKENFSSIMTAVRDLQKSILQKQADIGRM